MRIKLALLLAVGLICGRSFGQEKERWEVTVAGMVCDRDSLNPLPDAVWRLDGKMAGVDEEGRFGMTVRVGDTIQATQTGHKAILTPATHMYLDFPESRTPGEVKAATWMPPISVEKCYSMDVNDYSAQSTVIGVQGCLWSDQFIHGEVLQEITPLNEDRSERYAEYLTFPRLLAVSEVAWTPKARRDYADFAQRLTTQYARLDNND